MPSQPNTLGIMQSIQTIVQGLQVGGATFFPTTQVVIGKFKDITNLVPACEITMTDDNSHRYTIPGGLQTGGKIDDSQLFLIEVTLDMTDSQAVEVQLAQIRDSLTQAFHSSATLNPSGTGLQGVAYSGWEGEKGTEMYAMRNGIWYRIYRRKLHVRYEYAATMTL